MKIKWFMVILLMAALSACVHNPSIVNTSNIKSFKNFGVSLQPLPAANKVKVRSKAQGANRNGKKDGFVGYAKGEQGLTFFSIKNEDLGDFCEKADTTGDAEWVITGLHLSATGDPNTEKGTNFGGDQKAYPWLKEAFPEVDLDNGEVFNVNKDQGVTFLPIFNANGQLGYQFIYYQVTLTRCSDGFTLKTDPGWGNGGRN